MQIAGKKKEKEKGAHPVPQKWYPAHAVRIYCIWHKMSCSGVSFGTVKIEVLVSVPFGEETRALKPGYIHNRDELRHQDQNQIQ